MASECPPTTGTRTAVAVTLTVLSLNILHVSFVSFISSFVYPFSVKESQWGRQFLSIWWAYTRSGCCPARSASIWRTALMPVPVMDW